MKPILFNINDSVWIQLTDIGREIYYHQDDELNTSYGREVISPKYPKETNKWFSMQLWKVMELFGPYIHLGGELPFLPEISLVDPNKQEAKG